MIYDGLRIIVASIATSLYANPGFGDQVAVT